MAGSILIDLFELRKPFQLCCFRLVHAGSLEFVMLIRCFSPCFEPFPAGNEGVTQTISERRSDSGGYNSRKEFHEEYSARDADHGAPKNILWPYSDKGHT